MEVDSSQAVDIFLESGLFHGVKIFYYSEYVFDYEQEQGKEDFNDWKEEELDVIKSFDGSPFFLRIFWLDNGSIISYSFFEKWYLEFRETIETKKHANDEGDRLYTETYKEKIQECAKKVASHHKFFAYHTRPRKIEELIKMAIRENGSDLSLIIEPFMVKSHAESIFNEKYAAEARESFRSHVLAHKARGKSKKEIIALLDATEGLVDGFYYG